MSTFAQDMAEFEDEWTETAVEDRGGDYVNLPDGSYQAQITHCRIDTRDDDYIWFIRLANNQGSISKFIRLNNEIGRRIAKADAAMLGYDISGGWAGFDEWLESEDAIGLVCDIRVRTKDPQYPPDVYINKVHGKDAVVQGTADEDIPF